jgi:membrane-associated phospholipid phosphatase
MPRSTSSAGARISLGALVSAGAALGAGKGVREVEARLFQAANHLPGELFPLVWAPMQFGTLLTVPVLGALAFRAGRRELALRLVLGGAGAYVGARLLKRLTPRSRPGALLPDVRLRGVDAGDDGFPSGHAAVSTALATAIASQLPAPWGGVAGALAITTSFGRMYVGAHLPLDVLGGAGIGLALASILEIARGENDPEAAG